MRVKPLISHDKQATRRMIGNHVLGARGAMAGRAALRLAMPGGVFFVRSAERGPRKLARPVLFRVMTITVAGLWQNLRLKGAAYERPENWGRGARR